MTPCKEETRYEQDPERGQTFLDLNPFTMLWGKVENYPVVWHYSWKSWTLLPPLQRGKRASVISSQFKASVPDGRGIRRVHGLGGLYMCEGSINAELNCIYRFRSNMCCHVDHILHGLQQRGSVVEMSRSQMDQPADPDGSQTFGASWNEERTEETLRLKSSYMWEWYLNNWPQTAKTGLLVFKHQQGVVK